MPKAGIIFNDSKPTATKTAQQLEQQLQDRGYEVLSVTGERGLLACVTLTNNHTEQTIQGLVPEQFDLVRLSSTWTAEHSNTGDQYWPYGIFDRNLFE